MSSLVTTNCAPTRWFPRYATGLGGGQIPSKVQRTPELRASVTVGASILAVAPSSAHHMKAASLYRCDCKFPGLPGYRHKLSVPSSKAGIRLVHPTDHPAAPNQASILVLDCHPFVECKHSCPCSVLETCSCPWIPVPASITADVGAFRERPLRDSFRVAPTYYYNPALQSAFPVASLGPSGPAPPALVDEPAAPCAIL